MAENINYRIDKIENDMRYLRYLQNTSNKKDVCRRPPMPNVKPLPCKKNSLSNYIRVSKPAFQPSTWSNRANPPTPYQVRCLDFEPYDSCDPLCKAPCQPPAPYVEPPPCRAPYDDPYTHKPSYKTECMKSCKNPCSENSRRPAKIYKNPTLTPLNNNDTDCRPVPIVYDELPCIPLWNNPCSERPVPPPTYSNIPCVPLCKEPCNKRRPPAIYEDPCCIPREKCQMKPVIQSHKRNKCRKVVAEDSLEAAGAVRAVAVAKANKASGLIDATGSKRTHSYERRPSDPDELRAADTKMRELENRLRESSEKLREAEDNQRATERKLQASEEQLRVLDYQLRESEERLQMLEEKLRESEELLTQSEEQVHLLESEMNAMGDKLRGTERENENLRSSLETSRTSSRRNSEAQSMALDLATKIADKYKAASAEKVEAQNQIDELKAEGDALLAKLRLAERKAEMLAKEAEKPHGDCEEILNQRTLEMKLYEQSLKEMEARALAAEQTAQQAEDLKTAAAASMMRAAEAEARADEERMRAEEASQRAKQLEEETRLADERANEAENDARDARQRAKDAEQRADDLGATSDDQKKGSNAAGKNRAAGAAELGGKKKPCRCGRSRSRKRTKEEAEYQPPKKHKCCLCCCKKVNLVQPPRPFPPRQINNR